MSLSQSQPISMSLSGGSKGATPRPLFLDQTEGRRAKKNFWDLAPLYITAWICHCHLLPFLLCYSVYYKVSLLLTSVPLFLIPKKKPQGTLYQESREWWPFHNIHISLRFSKGALKAISTTRVGCVRTLDLCWNISERHEKKWGRRGLIQLWQCVGTLSIFFYFLKGQVISYLVHRGLWLLCFFGMTQTRQ